MTNNYGSLYRGKTGDESGLDLRLCDHCSVQALQVLMLDRIMSDCFSFLVHSLYVSFFRRRLRKSEERKDENIMKVNFLSVKRPWKKYQVFSSFLINFLIFDSFK